jgi:hypothetical protein
MPEQGQAELVGYALVFSAIILTVGLVTISGQAGLVELRDSQRTANVATGFSVLSKNIDDVVQGDAPSRATELDLSGGALSFGDPVTMSVRATDSGSELFEQSRTFRPVVYEAPNGARLVYATGAVIVHGKNGGTVMRREPRLLLDSSRTIVPIVNTTLNRERGPRAVASVDGESRVLIRTERERRTQIASTDRDVEVTITIDSPRTSAWESYFERELGPGDNCIESVDDISCTFTTDRASVVEARIGISFE